MNLNIFDPEDCVLTHFFVYTTLILGLITWAIIRHIPVTPMCMYGLFFITVLEALMLADLADWDLKNEIF